MRRFRRPVRPTGFATAAAAHAAAVAAKVAATGGVPMLADKDFPDLWSQYKSHFIRAQRGRCGYCERHVSDAGHMDHYAPKAVVGDLAAPGREADDAFNVHGRKTPRATSGYWWRAYEWENWLLTCERCNTGWKRTLFPLGGTRRVPMPGRNERRLLLGPFVADDPVAHLQFDRLGQIATRDGSAKGRATIETCGLDRESLRGARESIAATAHRLCDRVLAAQTAGDASRRQEACADLLHMAAPIAAHSGMVAAIIWSEIKLDLAGLKALRSAP